MLLITGKVAKIRYIKQSLGHKADIVLLTVLSSDRPVRIFANPVHLAKQLSLSYKNSDKKYSELSNSQKKATIASAFHIIENTDFDDIIRLTVEQRVANVTQYKDSSGEIHYHTDSGFSLDESLDMDDKDKSLAELSYHSKVNGISFSDDLWEKAYLGSLPKQRRIATVASAEEVEEAEEAEVTEDSK